MLNRRLLMAQAGATPPEDWDIDWKYTDGPLEKFGWTKDTAAGGYSDLRENGLYLNGGHVQWGYVQYHCPVQTAKKAIAELDFELLSYSHRTGLKTTLSNGNNGLQIFVYDKGVESIVSPPIIIFPPIPLKTDTMMRFEYDVESGNRVYVNGELVYDTSVFSTAYISENKILQQHGGEAVLKALRYKFIER